jgi:hypothetical protein
VGVAVTSAAAAAAKVEAAAARGTSSKVEVVRMAQITLLRLGTKPDSRNPALRATFKSQFAWLLLWLADREVEERGA